MLPSEGVVKLANLQDLDLTSFIQLESLPESKLPLYLPAPGVWHYIPYLEIGLTVPPSAARRLWAAGEPPDPQPEFLLQVGVPS